MNRRPPKRAKGAPRAPPASLRDGRGSAPTLPTSSGHRARTFAVSTMMTREPTRNDMVQRGAARRGASKGYVEAAPGSRSPSARRRAARCETLDLCRLTVELLRGLETAPNCACQLDLRSFGNCTAPRCFGVQLHARRRPNFSGPSDEFASACSHLYSSLQPPTPPRTTTRRR